MRGVDVAYCPCRTLLIAFYAMLCLSPIHNRQAIGRQDHRETSRRVNEQRNGSLSADVCVCVCVCEHANTALCLGL